MSIGPLGTNFSEILIKIQKPFIHKNAPESIVCEMVAILFKGRWVNNPDPWIQRGSDWSLFTCGFFEPLLAIPRTFPN